MQSTEVEAPSEIHADPRWELVERIVATDPFRRSARFRDLLRYLTERALTQHLDDLTETRIGHAVFSKPADYSPTEDSTVRVHVRQLRLKLHEYFDVAGREEPIILEIPKGGFVPVFRENTRLRPSTAAEAHPSDGVVASAPALANRRVVTVLAAAVVVLSLLSVGLFIQLRSAVALARTPWPMSFFAESPLPTAIVTADVNYGMHNLLEQRHRSLQEYLTEQVGSPPPSGPDQSLLSYIDQSSLTSSADAVIAAGLASLMAHSRSVVSIRSARDLRPRDLDNGNFIFLGSPTSNPWVTEFLDQTNFEEMQDASTGAYYWHNKAPRAGEQAIYKCLHQTGTSGDDFADIAFLPSSSGRGFVMLLQGCQQEGTESTLTYLSTDKGRAELLRALGLSRAPSSPVFFEALVRTQVIAGAPNSTEIVAARTVRTRN